MKRTIVDVSALEKEQERLATLVKSRQRKPTNLDRLYFAPTASWSANVREAAVRHLPPKQANLVKKDRFPGGGAWHKLQIMSPDERLQYFLSQRKEVKKRKVTTEDYEVKVYQRARRRIEYIKGGSTQISPAKDEKSESEEKSNIESKRFGQGSHLVSALKNMKIEQVRRQRRLRSNGQARLKPQVRAKVLKFAERLMGFCMLFLKLRKFTWKFAQARRRSVQSHFNKFARIIDGTVRYLRVELYWPLYYYRKLLRRYMADPTRHYNSEAMSLIQGLLNKLKTIGLPKQLFLLLRDISGSRSFIPTGLLSRYQLKRVPISLFYGHILNPSEDVTRMIVGHVMCCRILLHRLLMCPWSIPTHKGSREYSKKHQFNLPANSEAKQDQLVTRQDYPKYRQIAENICSGFYCIYLRTLSRMPNFATNKTTLALRRLHHHFAAPLPTCPSEHEVERDKNNTIRLGLFQSCNKTYYKRMLKADSESVSNIQSSMEDWLTRISYKAHSIAYKD